MCVSFNVFESRHYYSSGPFHSRRTELTITKASNADWKYGAKMNGRIGRVWQLSKRSWRFQKYGNDGFRSASIPGKARTMDEAIQKLMR